MLKATGDQSLSNHLLEKARMIVITNACNLNCGGCSQLVGQFSKKKIWFISLDDLEKSIRLLEENPVKTISHRPITIFGGEPTLHPQWREITAILKRHASTTFWINTNGRLGQQRYQKEDNLVWWVDLHPQSQLFVQTMYAAKDAVKLPNDMAYWEKAQKDCELWKKCQSTIYNGKSYFCENAGAIDWLFNNGENGWVIEDGKHPFDKSKKEIDAQAEHCCKRCGWCVAELIPRQLSKDPTYVSPSNQIDDKKNYIASNPIETQSWSQQLELNAIPPDIGIFRLPGAYPSTEISDLEFVTEYEVENKQSALQKGRNAHEWTIILDKNQIIPNYAFFTLVNWMEKESTKEYRRSHVSIPIYEVNKNDYNSNMIKPDVIPKSVIIAFHKSSTDQYDDDIYSRLGHRNIAEGSGRASLWHDKLTDVIGGVVSLQ